MRCKKGTRTCKSCAGRALNEADDVAFGCDSGPSAYCGSFPLCARHCMMSEAQTRQQGGLFRVVTIRRANLRDSSCNGSVARLRCVGRRDGENVKIHKSTRIWGHQWWARIAAGVPLRVCYLRLEFCFRMWRPVACSACRASRTTSCSLQRAAACGGGCPIELGLLNSSMHTLCSLDPFVNRCWCSQQSLCWSQLQHTPSSAGRTLPHAYGRRPSVITMVAAVDSVFIPRSTRWQR